MNPMRMKRIYASFNGGGKAALPELCQSLLEEQKTSWQELRDGYDGLTLVKERRIQEGDFSVALQCNPQRIKSAVADIDPAAIKARPCFLCWGNLPEAQKALLYRRRYLILGNPFPIFASHFTIAHVDHIPQSLLRALPSLLQLAKDFKPDFALLYNGPQCGASAPDHLHFQAIPKAAVPVLKDKGAEKNRILKKETGGVRLFKALRDGAPFLIVEGQDKREMAAFLRRLIRAMKRLFSSTNEPMMNLFCLYEGAAWRAVVFPRSRHRPDVYFKSGDDRIIISPGAVDMGGLLIVPREEDFTRLDAATILNILREVSLSDEMIEKITAAI